MLCSENQGSSFVFPGEGSVCCPTESLWSFQPQAPRPCSTCRSLRCRMCSLVTAWSLWPLPRCSPGAEVGITPKFYFWGLGCVRKGFASNSCRIMECQRPCSTSWSTHSCSPAQTHTWAGAIGCSWGAPSPQQGAQEAALRALPQEHPQLEGHTRGSHLSWDSAANPQQISSVGAL